MEPATEKIYLDYNATTPLACEVVDCVTEALKIAWANPSSSTDIGRTAKQLINDSREKVAAMIEAKETEILFLSGGTEANNMVIHTALKYFESWLKKSGKENCKPHIITTTVEHDAILLPLKYYETQKEIEVDYIDVSNTHGQVHPKEIESKISENTCLVSVMLANNETGVLMPVAEISRKINDLNKSREQVGLCRILIHTDAAQAFGKIPVSVGNLGIDYLTIVGHKFYGPRIGALYVKGLEENITPLFPMFFGGGQERGFRPGTENTAMINGLGCAAELVTKNIKFYEENMREMRDLLEQLLKESFGDNVVFNCNIPERLPNTSNVSFNNTQMSGGDILSCCPKLMASTGAACHGIGKPSAILMASGVSIENARSAIRLSVGRHTSSEEIKHVVEMLKAAVVLQR